MTEPSTLDMSLIGYNFRMHTRRKFIDERKKQGVKLGHGKGSNTENKLDNLKESKKQNSKF